MAPEKTAPRPPVFRISWEAYRFVFRHAMSLAKLVWLPFLVLIAARATPIYVMVTHGASVSGIWYWVINAVFLFVFPALVAVNWHRYVLLGPLRIGSFDALRIRKPELLFLAVTAVLIFATSSVPDVVLNIFGKKIISSYVPEELQGFSFLVFRRSLLVLLFLALCRFYILLPVTAIGERPSVSRAWQLTKNNTFRVFAIICLTSGLSGATLTLLFAYFSRAIPFDAISSVETVHPLLIIYVTGATVSSLTAIFCGSLGATALSLCYRHLTGMDGVVEVRKEPGAPPTTDP